MDTFQLNIITPDETVLKSDSIIFLKAPGQGAELGVLANHTPALMNLEPGALLIRNADSETWYFVPGGVLEVQTDKVQLLCDYLEMSKTRGGHFSVYHGVVS